MQYKLLSQQYINYLIIHKNEQKTTNNYNFASDNFSCRNCILSKIQTTTGKKIKGAGIGQEPIRQGQQKLNAVGFIIVPTHLSDLIKQPGHLTG